MGLLLIFVSIFAKSLLRMLPLRTIFLSTFSKNIHNLICFLYITHAFRIFQTMSTSHTNELLFSSILNIPGVSWGSGLSLLRRYQLLEFVNTSNFLPLIFLLLKHDKRNYTFQSSKLQLVQLLKVKCLQT